MDTLKIVCLALLLMSGVEGCGQVPPPRNPPRRDPEPPEPEPETSVNDNDEGSPETETAVTTAVTTPTTTEEPKTLRKVTRMETIKPTLKPISEVENRVGRFDRKTAKENTIDESLYHAPRETRNLQRLLDLYGIEPTILNTADPKRCGTSLVVGSLLLSMLVAQL